TTRVFRRQFSEMTELVNTLAFLPDSTDQIEALKIREGDAKEIKREGIHGDEMINLLLFHAINALLAVFQANKQIRGLHAASGCL
ncbi:hypothetical protein E2K61_14410, partial [Escherichia coli]